MNEKTLRALVDAGAVKRIRIVADGARFHVEADTPTATIVAVTGKGAPKTWGRWMRRRSGYARWASALRNWMSAGGNRNSVDFGCEPGIAGSRMDARQAERLLREHIARTTELVLCEG